MKLSPDAVRTLLGERIVALCKVTGRNLKDKIGFVELIPLALVLMTGYAQSTLGGFPQGDETGSLNDSKSEPGLKEPESNDDSGEEASTEQDDPSRGLVYARVSSERQLSDETDETDEESEYDEGSIEGQIEELVELAESEGIDLPYEPITDEAETGTNFDREGIQEVFEICKDEEIDYLLVEKVDRIGRDAPETLYFIYILQSKCEVTLLTPSGERDIDTVDGLMHTTLLSLMAEVQNQIRTKKAKKERIRGFLKKKKWKCKSPKIPLGYDETDDGWLEVNPEEKEIVRDLFQKFIRCKTYTEVESYIDSRYGSHVLEGHRVKTLLTNRVYIGEPRLPEEWIIETSYENDLEEPALHLLEDDPSSSIDVSEETFWDAQEIIDKKDEIHSSDEPA